MMLNFMRNELDMLWQKRKMSMVIMMFAALLYALLLGNLYKGGIVQNIPVAVCDLDNSAVSRQLIETVADADQYNLRVVYSEESKAVAALEDGQVETVLVIPPDFAQKLVRGQQVRLNYLVDGSNALHASYANAPMQSVVGTFASVYRRQQDMLLGTPQLAAQAVNISVRVTQNSTQNYGVFYLYGIVLAAAQVGLMLCFGGSVFIDKKTASRKPMYLIRFWLAKELLYVLFSVVTIILGCFVLHSIWQLPMDLHIVQFGILYSCFVFAVLNLAGLAALLCKTELALVQLLVFYTLPSFMLSGYIWPQLAMTLPMKFLSYCIPLHYIANDFRSLGLSGNAPHWLFNSSILFGIGIVLLTANIALSERR